MTGLGAAPQDSASGKRGNVYVDSTDQVVLWLSGGPHTLDSVSPAIIMDQSTDIESDDCEHKAGMLSRLSSAYSAVICQVRRVYEDLSTDDGKNLHHRI
jgi:hypothetical protein